MQDSKKLITVLSEFGLDESDARLYLGLLQFGSVTVGSISSKLEIDRGKAYRSLNRLRNLGLVSTTFSNPTICHALEPQDAIDTIIQKKMDEIVTMRKVAKEINTDLKQMSKEKGTIEESSFSIIQGRLNVYARIGKLIHQAKKTVYIVTTVDDVLRMYHTSIPEKIALRKKNGVDIKLLTYTNSENLLPLIDRLGPSESRIGKLPSKSRMIVEKDHQLIISDSINESMNWNDENDSILYTNSAEMVSNIYSLCNVLWKKSKGLEILLKK